MESRGPLHIIRITCNGELFKVLELFLPKAGPDGTIVEDCHEHEKWLKDYLDYRVRQGGETYTFSWKYRSVVSVSVPGLEKGSEKWLGDYVMYTCGNGDAGMFTYQANSLISKYRASHEACPGSKRH